MIFLVVGLILAVSINCQEIDDSIYYTAAIHEHAVKGNYLTNKTEEYIKNNLAFYKKSTSIAGKHKADIIVFPEYGLFPPTNNTDAIHNMPYVPDPVTEKWNPCLQPSKYNDSYILANLSCTARENNIVILANILEKVSCNNISSCKGRKFYFYNTNVAFNRSGMLIARYRKTHLFYEDSLNVLSEPESIVFETDFARIGTFSCFDIVWKESVQMVEKYKPDTVIFSALWIEFFPPGMNSLQVQQSWAIVNNVTILAANRQHPQYGALGSGVFFGDTGIGNYIYEGDGQSRLLISKVPKRGIKPPQGYPPATIIEFDDKVPGKADNNITSGVCSPKILGPPSGFNDFRCIMEFDLSNFTLAKVENGNRLEVCNNGLCCQSRYKAKISKENYYLAVLNGTYTSYKRYTWWLEACLLVRCDSFEGKPCSVFSIKSDTVFEELKMRANFSTSYVYPSISVNGGLAPREKWSYSDNGLHFRTKTDKLLFATLYGRAYNRDPE